MTLTPCLILPPGCFIEGWDGTGVVVLSLHGVSSGQERPGVTRSVTETVTSHALWALHLDGQTQMHDASGWCWFAESKSRLDHEQASFIIEQPFGFGVHFKTIVHNMNNVVFEQNNLMFSRHNIFVQTKPARQTERKLFCNSGYERNT